MSEALAIVRPSRRIIPTWAPMLISGQARTAFVVFGGLAVLQSSEGLGLIKIAYLFGVALALVGALSNLRQLETTAAYRLLRPLLGLSLLFAALVALSLGVAIANGTPVTAWLRDAAPYFFFASVPIFALDLRASASTRFVVAMFVIAGLLASFSYTIEWLDRRNLADLPFGTFALPSSGLRSAIYIYALSGVLLSREPRTGWTVLSALVLSWGWIIAGRIDTLALPLIALVIGALAIKRDRQFVRPTLRLLTVGGLALLFALVFILSMVRFSDYNTSILTSRLGPLAQISIGRSTDTGSVTTGLRADPSYQERSVQTRLAWQTFISEPILGTGPGHTFAWDDSQGRPRVSFQVDTSLSVLAKFGIVGITLILTLAIAFMLFLRNAARGSGITVAQTALVSYAALALLISPFAVPLEDKGFSFGLLFLLALSLPSAATPDRVREGEAS